MLAWQDCKCHWLVISNVCLCALTFLAYRDGVVLLNPGSVGRLRKLGVEVVAILDVDDDVGAG